jgi:hypothetical protein
MMNGILQKMPMNPIASEMIPTNSSVILPTRLLNNFQVAPLELLALGTFFKLLENALD